MTLLYQLFLANQAARRFMRLALAGTELGGDEYALLSYLFGNGPRTMSQAARDFGLPVTTVATLLGPMVAAGEIERRPHPTDGRARLLLLTDAGRSRLEAAIPEFSAAYRTLLTQLQEAGVDPESVFTALDQLRSGVARATSLLEAEGH